MQLRRVQPWHPVVLCTMQLFMLQGAEHMAFLIKGEKIKFLFPSFTDQHLGHSLVSDYLARIHQISNPALLKEAQSKGRRMHLKTHQKHVLCPLTTQLPTPCSALSVRPYSKRLNKKGRQTNDFFKKSDTVLPRQPTHNTFKSADHLQQRLFRTKWSSRVHLFECISISITLPQKSPLLPVTQGEQM